ncbi:MAG: PEGA domain-containing protein [Lentisphaeria bacterium]|nr:PEGA domain-containing protein [Lentisphaeria bacterium]
MKRFFHKFRCLTAVLVCGLILPGLVSCAKKPVSVKAKVELKSDPAGATVTIKGIERGTTPLKGSMNPGVYLVKFSMEGYKNHWEKVELGRLDRKTIEVSLEPETASVLITSSPDSAEVEFEGKKLGQTPIVIPDLRHGQYKAELYRHGYSRQTASWTINSAVPKLVDINLDSNVGLLVLDSKPSGAEVFLDGKPVGRTPLKEQVEEGKHSIEVRKNGYNPAFQTVQITSKTTVKVPAIVLDYKKGSIKITSSPSGAQITINGTPYGDTPFKLPDLKPGNYEIRLEKAGFDPAERTVKLPPGEHLDLKFNLDSNTGGVDIVTQPAGLTLYLDGKKIGISEKDPENRSVSKIYQVRNLSMGEHKLTIAHKRARPEKKTFSFTITKENRIIRPGNLSLWIPNAEIVRDNGKREIGRIIQDLPRKYEFEPSPGVKFTIEKSTVKKITWLPETE